MVMVTAESAEPAATAEPAMMEVQVAVVVVAAVVQRRRLCRRCRPSALHSQKSAWIPKIVTA
jgi:hypothetical protein